MLTQKRSHENAQAVMLVGIVVLILVFSGLGARLGSYLVFAAIVFASFYLRKELTKETPLDKRLHKAGKGMKLTGGEKRLLIYYLLGQLDEADSVDLNRMESEFVFPTFTVNNVIKWLEKKGLIKTSYPPMSSLPVIQYNAEKKARKMMDKIANSRRKDFNRFQLIMTRFLRKYRRL